MLFAPKSTEMSRLHIGQPWQQCAAPTEFRQGGSRGWSSQTLPPTSPNNRNRWPPPFFFFLKPRRSRRGAFHCDCVDRRKSGRGSQEMSGLWEWEGVVANGANVHREHAFARWMWMASVCLQSKERLRTWCGSRIPLPFIILLVCLGAALGIVSRHFSSTTTPASYKFKEGVSLLLLLLLLIYEFIQN